MAREVRFRAWDKNDKVIRCWENLMATVYYHKGDTVFNDNGLIITQYTGLKDCKGNEIYEGDILAIEQHMPYISNNKWVVEWCEINHCWGIYRDKTSESYTWYSFSNLNGFESDSKIIGNIYENPELIRS